MLPETFPNWTSVYAYFAIWTEKNDETQTNILEDVLKKLVREIRTKNGRSAKTSFCIVDAQSVKNTDTAEEKGYDAGKKVSGIKRHIATENLFEVEKMVTDGGYTEERFATAIFETIEAEVEVVKRND
ncbi:IS5/IS1182 family transposase, partial [bacterium]|nr:IS5/IS1182 family transposase [bacterium]